MEKRVRKEAGRGEREKEAAGGTPATNEIDKGRAHNDTRPYWSMLCARRARAPGFGGSWLLTTGHGRNNGRNNGQEKGQKRAVNVRWHGGFHNQHNPLLAASHNAQFSLPVSPSRASRASLPPPPAYQMFAGLLGCHHSVTGAETVDVCSLGPLRHNCLACLT